MITPVYAAVLALVFVALSIRVIKLRKAQGVALGDNGDEGLRRAIRAQANFAEYTPLALLLIWMLETQTGAGVGIHLLALVLVFARLCHALNIARPNERIGLRVLGMSLTFLVIVVSALALLAAGLLM